MICDVFARDNENRDLSASYTLPSGTADASSSRLVIRPFNCSLLSSLHSELAHGTVVVLAPSELVRVAETARAWLIRALPVRHWIARGC